MNELTLSNGDAAAGNGGAILLNAGSLSLNRSTFSANRAAAGGALYATGPTVAGQTLTVIDSAFTGNTASAGAGGAVDSLGPATVTLLRAHFQGNSAALNGGGAVNAQTTGGASVTAGVFAQNTSNGGNGGGAIFAAGPIAIADSYIHDNVSAGGGGGVSGPRTHRVRTVPDRHYRQRQPGERRDGRGRRRLRAGPSDHAQQHGRRQPRWQGRRSGVRRRHWLNRV